MTFADDVFELLGRNLTCGLVNWTETSRVIDILKIYPEFDRTDCGYETNASLIYGTKRK